MSENQPRILIFSTNYLPFIGGAELATKEIMDRLGGDFEIDLITARHSSRMPRKERLGRILVYRVGLGIPLLDKLFLPFLGYLLARGLHGRKTYDFIHSVQASFGGITAFFFKKAYPLVPFVLNLQEGKELNRQRLYIHFWRKKVIKAADKVVVISRYLKDYVKKLGVESDKIYLIPNGVDLNKFGKDFAYSELEETKDELNIKPYEKVVITSSRLERKNNVEAVIDAIHKLKNKDIKLVIIGDGSLRNYLETKVKNLGMQERIMFLGTVKHEELPKYLAISHVFVRPSISEGLGTAFLEAMAAGVPVIGTNIGGIPDFLKDFRTGLFTSACADDIAKKINLVLGDRELRKQLINNGKKLVEEKYQWDDIAGQYKELYLEL